MISGRCTKHRPEKLQKPHKIRICKPNYPNEKFHLYKALLLDRVAVTNLQIKTPVQQVHRGKKELKTSYFFQLAKKIWISFFFFIIYSLGYPVGYLKYPRGVERMVFEVVRAQHSYGKMQ